MSFDIYIVSGGAYEQHMVYGAYATRANADAEAARINGVSPADQIEIQRLYCETPSGEAKEQAKLASKRVQNALAGDPCIVEVMEVEP